MKDLWHKFNRKWMKLRLQPIRVYCFHHVCAKYDVESMNEGDWMQIDEFKSRVLVMLQDGVEFISLSDAYKHLTTDYFRYRQYAVITFDDGYASLKEILPWLEEQRIPATLFINGKYLDGKSYRTNPQEKYLTQEELFALTSPLLEIGSHGWEHTDAAKMSEFEFEEYMSKNIELLPWHARYIPFHAYTWGRHTNINDDCLVQMHLVPVLMDGMKNYAYRQYIHRELLEK